MTVIITLQPAELPSCVRPYPYHVNPNGTVRRQDFWRGRVARVIGFTDRLDVEEISLPWHKAVENPQAAVGRYVVTSDDQNCWFTFPTPIEAVRVQEERKSPSRLRD